MFTPKLIVFDLNKTLIHENSWLDLNLAMGVTQAEDDMLMRWWSERVISDQQGQDILCALYASRSYPTREAIWDAIRHYTYTAGARELVSFVQSHGYHVALISGAMDILVAHVAIELGISHWRAASTFMFDDKGVLERIRCAPNDAKHKAEMLSQLCDELGIRPTECMAIGDGDNDAHIFELTGHGVTFTSSLIASSAEHVVDTLSDIVPLLNRMQD